MKAFYILCVFVLLNETNGFNVETIRHCCELGTEHANKKQECLSVKDLLPSVDKSEEGFCLNSLSVCCKTELKEKECKLGIEDSNTGNCAAPTGSERKYCCDACSFGKIAKSTGTSCDSNIGLGAPYDQHYQTCCKEDKTTTPKPTTTSNKVSTVSKNEPLPTIENMCDIEGLCAQICIPTADSYKCDCNPGYSLMTDGISCKEIKQKPTTSKKSNSCETNNPCDHNCIDTGVAIQCTCKEGFQLGKDKTSCRDIDECALGIHSCMESEVCVNGEGYYDCESYSDVDYFFDKECPEGYKFNGEKKLCDDINECEIPLMCEHSQTCENTIGSYKCNGGEFVCPPGFHYKSSTQDCEDIDECILGKDDCNRESQVCLNTKGNFTCRDKASKTTCPPGFKMNPYIQDCQDIDECVENPELCPEDKICVNEPGGHTCIAKTSSDKPTYNAYPSEVQTTTRRTTITKATTHRTTATKPTTIPTTKPTTKPTTQRITTTRPTTTTTATPPTITTRRSTAQIWTTTMSTTARTHRQPYLIPKPPPLPRIPDYVRPFSSSNCPRGFRFSPEQRQCIDIDECLEDAQACGDNYQDCYNTVGSYECKCKLGFTRDETTRACVDVNECQVGASDCTDGQRCDNTIGSFLCSRVAGCGTGYTLNFASGLCEDDDECRLGTHTCDKLGTHLECRNTPGSYRCEVIRPILRPPVVYTFPVTNFTIFTGQSKKCLPGYNMDLRGNCIDINECESNPCNRGQKCINLRGRYQCVSRFECKGGFELNEEGDGCIDINECARGIHACSSTQICKNYEGYHVCLCPSGHKPVNNECVDINECEYYKGRICQTTSYCMNTIGSYKCICKDGFRDEGGKCNDVDECRETPGLCDQKCVNFWGGYRCSCERGFTLAADNRTCTDMDECEKFKDKNLCIGNCENVPGSYVCRCPPGFKLASDGRSCLDIDECATQQPCHGRDMICFNTRGSYECPSIVCPPNYIRDPDHKSRCKKDPKCTYLGTCTDSPEQYTYHFFNLISNLPLLHGQVKFFQMKGPIWDTSMAKFNLKLENVRCPHNVQKVDSSYFRVNREPRKADISFVKSIQGPQQIELSFEMQLFSNNLFSARVVSKIFIFVSEYSF